MSPQEFADKHPADFADVEFYFDFDMKYRSSRIRHEPVGADKDIGEGDGEVSITATTRAPIKADTLQQSLLLT